jgi:hypothetical protein
MRREGSVSLEKGIGHPISGMVDAKKGIADVEANHLSEDGAVGKSVRLAAGLRECIRPVVEVVQVAAMGRRVGDVDDTTGRLLPGSVDCLLQPAQDVLGDITSARGDKSSQESADLAWVGGEVQILDVRRVAMVLVAHHRHADDGLVEERGADVVHDADDLSLRSLDVGQHRCSGVYEKEQVGGADCSEETAS